MIGGKQRRFRSAAMAVVGLCVLAGCEQTHGHAGVTPQAGGDSRAPDSSFVDAVAPADARAPSEASPPLHRPEATACGQATGAFETPPLPEMGNSARPCNSDADCTAADGGHCTDYPGNPLRRCYYDQCRVDEHCPGGTLCECGRERSASSMVDGAIPSRCVPSDCRVDTDCDAPGFCSPTPGRCGPIYGTAGYNCHTPSDECLADDDCDGDAYCAYDLATKRWRCRTERCAGKPG